MSPKQWLLLLILTTGSVIIATGGIQLDLYITDFFPSQLELLSILARFVILAGTSLLILVFLFSCFLLMAPSKPKAAR